MTFRLIERASDSNANQDPLIDFKLTKSETNDTTGQYYMYIDLKFIINISYVYTIVEANVNNVEVLVDLPFILMLKDFAMESIKPLTSPAKNDEIEDAGVLPLSPTPTSPTASGTVSPVPSKESSPTKSNEESLSQGRVTITAKIQKPLIALLEDADDRDSRALVLSVSNPCLCKS